MRRTTHFAATAALLALPIGAMLQGCAPAVVAGTAMLVNDEVAENSKSVVVGYEADYVWASAKSTLSHMTDDLLDVDPDLRTIKTYVDGALVVVHVETFQVGETRIRVEAKRYLVFSDEVATNVRNGIQRDLG